MLKLARVSWGLMHRMAVRLWLLFFIGVAMHGGLRTWSWTYLLGAVALGCCYASGAAINDIADEPIDRMNLSDSSDRALLTGDATRSGLARLAAVLATAALLAAARLGPAAVGFIVLGLLIGVTYSLAPLRLARRTFVAPLILAVGYVLVSYGLGTVVAGGGIERGDAVAAALFTLYVGRVNLKDFRDRAGDAAYGRRPILLRFGKRTTCLVTATCLLVGDVLLSAALHPSAWMLVLIQLSIAAIAVTLLRLYRATNGRTEQAAIALSARMGDGLLLLVLAYQVMIVQAAPGAATAILCGAIAVGSALTLLANLNVEPELVVENLYKEDVLDHARSPRNKHPLPSAAVSCSRSNPYCGDEVRLYAEVGDAILERVAFDGQGCAISQASASMMTEAVNGKPFAHAARLADEFEAMMSGEVGPADGLGELVAMKGVAKHPARVRCAMLAFEVLRATLAEARSRASSPVSSASSR